MTPNFTIVCGLFQHKPDAPIAPRCKHGLYNPTWVDKLYRGFKRNLTAPPRMVCVSDWPQSTFAEPVEVVPWLHSDDTFLKLTECLRPDLGIGRGLFVNLDTVVIGNCDFMVEYSGEACFVAQPGHPENLCNPLVLFDGDWGRRVYDAWRRDPEGTAARHVWEDQHGKQPSEMQFWVAETRHPDAMAALFPGAVQDYHLEYRRARGISPSAARVLYFWSPRLPSRYLNDPVVRENWL